MGNEPKRQVLILHCPRIDVISEVVEFALQDALLSVLTHGECIEEGLHLGAFRRNLEDQIYEDDEHFVFAGSEQERWNYARDPHGVFNGYLQELNTTLATIAERNKPAIDLTQRAHWKSHLKLIKRLPNHWIIAVEGG